MDIRRCEALAACERFRMRSHCFGNKCPALFVQPSLVLNCLKHKCVGRFFGCLSCRHDPSLEVCGNL